jgi:hypothetical protein
VGMDEDEMTFEELRALMLSGTEAQVNPGPRPVLAEQPGRPTNLSSSLRITGANFDVTTGPEQHGSSRLGRPVRLIEIHRPMLVHAR